MGLPCGWTLIGQSSTRAQLTMITIRAALPSSVVLRWLRAHLSHLATVRLLKSGESLRPSPDA